MTEPLDTRRGGRPSPCSGGGRQPADGVDDAVGGTGKLARVDSFRHIEATVILGIAIWGGVGEHEGWVALLPERPVIGPVDPRDPFERGDALHGELAGGHEVAGGT